MLKLKDGEIFKDSYFFIFAIVASLLGVLGTAIITIQLTNSS